MCLSGHFVIHCGGLLTSVLPIYNNGWTITSVLPIYNDVYIDGKNNNMMDKYNKNVLPIYNNEK